MSLERKVEEYRQNLLRIIKMKKGLIDAEISLISLRTALNLSPYEWRKLIAGELQEREKDVWELIDKTPEYIKKRDKAYKHFQKILLDKDLKASEVAKGIGIDINKINRVLKRLAVNRDIETEKKIEAFLGVKVFE